MSHCREAEEVEDGGEGEEEEEVTEEEEGEFRPLVYHGACRERRVSCFVSVEGSRDRGGVVTTGGQGEILTSPPTNLLQIQL